jgi:hypothetical protein
MEGAIPQEQHTPPHRAQQAAACRALIGVPGPHAGVDDRVGAALAQPDELHPWPGALTARRRLTAERADVRRGVGHVERGPVHRQQAQAEEEGPRRGGGGKGPADAPEQQRQGARAQAVARLAEGTLAHREGVGLRPQPAQAADEAPEDVPQAVRRVQIHGHAEEQGDGCGQLADALLRRPAVLQDPGDGRRRQDMGEGFHREVRGHRVSGSDLPYHQGHALLLSAYWLRAHPVSPTGQRTPLSKRYWI